MFKKEPAVLIALALAVVAGVAEVQAVVTDSGWWAALPVAATVVAGILIRFHVVAPATIETILDEARTGGELATRIADTVGVALPPRPGNGG